MSGQDSTHEQLPSLRAAGWQVKTCELTPTTLFYGNRKKPQFILKQVEDNGKDLQLDQVLDLELSGVQSFQRHPDSSPEKLCLVRPFVEGQSLAEISTNTQSALEITLRIARILESLHQNSLLHGNLKLNNVIVDQQGNVVLVDGPFDFSSYCSSVDSLDNVQHLAYLAPEQLGIIHGKASIRSDLYSLGILLFETLTGKHPFSNCSPDDFLIRKVRNSHYRVLDRFGKPLTRVVSELIARLTFSDPAKRYQTVEAVIHDVELIQSAIEFRDNPSVPLGTTDRLSTIVESNFIGREIEVGHLSQELANGKVGRAGTAVIEAVSGCGKSTLLDDYAALADQLNYWVVRGIGQFGVAARSFQILDGLVQQLGERCKSDVDFRAALEQKLGDDIPVLCNVMPDLASTMGWSNQDLAGPEIFGHTRGIIAICNLLGALGTPQRPCTLILDDCQWIDESSVRLLETWSRERRSNTADENHVVLVVSFRQEEVPGDHPLRDLHPTSNLRIELFSERDVSSVARSMAGQLPDSVIQRVCKMAAGSPFMATAILRGLNETEALSHDGQKWTLDESIGDEFQSSSDAAQLLARRIDLLPPEVQDFLSHGAILGKSFHIQLVRKLLECKDFDLHEAVNKHLIWLDDQDESKVCHFVHDKIREELLNRKDIQQRKALHLKTANILEQENDASPIDLAYHFDAAGHHTAALPYALNNAEEARSQFLISLAVQQYEIAKRAKSPDLKVQFQIAQGLGEVQMLGGKYTESAEVLQEAANLSDNEFDRAWVLGRQGELAFKRGDMEDATIKIEESIRGLGARVPRNVFTLMAMYCFEFVVQLLHTLLPTLFHQRKKRLPDERERLLLRLGSRYSQACWFARSKLRCVWTHMRTLNRAELFLPCEEVAQAMSDHAPAMSLVPYPARGERFAKRSLKIRGDLNDTWGKGQSLHYYGIVLYSAARYADCIEACREAVRLLEKTGDHWEMHMARYQIAASLYNLGRIDEALHEARSLHIQGLDLGDQQASAISLDITARTQTEPIDLEVFDRELSRERIDSQGTAQLLLGKGIAQLSHGELTSAEKSFRAAIKQGRTSGIRSVYVLPNFAWLATTLRCRAELTTKFQPEQQNKLIRSARFWARFLLILGWPYKHSVPHALRELGLTSAMMGRTSQAVRHLKRSINVARRLDMKYEERLSRLALLRVNPRKDAEDERIQQKIDATPNARLIFPSRKARRTPHQRETLSLADRFNRVMVSGRNIASGLDEKSILDAVQAAALQLLRGQRCFTMLVNRSGSNLEFSDCPEQSMLTEPDWQIVRNAIHSGRAVACGNDSNQSKKRRSHGSLLAAPIVVRGRVHSCFVILHRDVDSLFNATEEKLADFVTTIAGAALENADGFSQLQRLNDDLEKRVDDRTATLKKRAVELGDANARLKKIARDLTEAQKELTDAKERVEMASQAKSEFLATMSHEIRTPINAVMGMTDLCMETDIDENQKGYLQVVKSSANSLLTLLNDILDLSKIEANKMELESIPFQARAVTENACDLLSINAFQKDLEIVCHVHPQVPDVIQGDPNRLQQIIVNLIGNAIKFTEQGQIVVRVKPTVGDMGQSFLQFSVIDTGVGIPQDKQDLIFESFSQADSSTTRKFGGTGLGLSICSRFVQMMGGRIWVESEPGHGSTFHFTVSVQTSPTLEVAHNTPNLPSLPATQRVWIATDNHVVRQALQDMIEGLYTDANLTCESVNSVSDILHETNQPDLLIMDVDHDQSAAIIDQLSADLQSGRTKILGLFRKDRTEFLRKYGKLPNSRLMARPCCLNRLVHCINSLFGETPAVPQKVENPETNEGPSLNILLAEDVDINAQIATRFIERLGHNVTLAENGVKALLAFQEQEFDAIFMDVEMPEMDGMEATRKIRELDTGDEIPIIAMTAHAIPEIRKKCMEAGMNNYITKPLEPEKLTALLKLLQDT